MDVHILRIILIVKSMIWRDRNLKFGPNYDLEEDNLEKKLKIWRGAAESPEIVENF